MASDSISPTSASKNSRLNLSSPTSIFTSSPLYSRPPSSRPISKQTAQNYYDSYQEPKTSKSRFEADEADEKKKARRKLLIWIAIAAAAVLLIALAVGLGVGLTRKGSSDTDGGQPNIDSGTTTSAATATSATSTSTTSSSAIASSTNTAIKCARSNGTVYTTNSKSFQIECGIDYPPQGNFETIDASNLAGCLDACATDERCIDATFLGSACYLKDSIGDPNYENSGVAGGRLID